MIQTLSKNEWINILRVCDEIAYIYKRRILFEKENEDKKEEIIAKRKNVLDIMNILKQFKTSDDFNLIIVQEYKRSTKLQSDEKNRFDIVDDINF